MAKIGRTALAIISGKQLPSTVKNCEGIHNLIGNCGHTQSLATNMGNDESKYNIF